MASNIGQTSLFQQNSEIVLRDVPCDDSVYIGSWVRMFEGTAFNALADVFENSNVIGLVETKTGTNLCTVRVTGLSKDLFAGLQEIYEYYLSADVPGGMSFLAPVGPGNIVLKLGQPYSSTDFVVLKGNRFRKAAA